MEDKTPKGGRRGNGTVYRYLALGDSYTIGESVPYAENFPSRLRDALQKKWNIKITLTIVATTGWRTDQLLNALLLSPPDGTFDLVTLLIGVNNQYQHTIFRQFRKELKQLLSHALSLTGNISDRVILISIPDYAYTPFAAAHDRAAISADIDRYNAYVEKTAHANKVPFINITELTRQGLERPGLVAQDGLHPSGRAYSLFVEEILPVVGEKWTGQ